MSIQAHAICGEHNMSRLRNEPPGRLQSLPELMAIAMAMEQEAAARYAQLAEAMIRLNNKEAFEIFTYLSNEERGHVDRVQEWSREVIHAPPNPADIRWELPPDLENEALADLAGSRMVTPYRALSIAVRNEERAFAFWSYMSAYSKDENIRMQAESIALEELRHVEILRKHRRRAYHAQMRRDPKKALPLPALKQKAHALEQRLSQQCMSMAAAAARQGDDATACLLREISEESGRHFAIVVEGGAQTSAGREVLGGAQLVGLLDAVLAALEAATEFYVDQAEISSDEQAVSFAQSLSQSAIKRLAKLRGRREEFARLPLEGQA